MTNTRRHTPTSTLGTTAPAVIFVCVCASENPHCRPPTTATFVHIFPQRHRDCAGERLRSVNKTKHTHTRTEDQQKHTHTHNKHLLYSLIETGARSVSVSRLCVCVCVNVFVRACTIGTITRRACARAHTQTHREHFCVVRARDYKPINLSKHT